MIIDAILLASQVCFANPTTDTPEGVNKCVADFGFEGFRIEDAVDDCTTDDDCLQRATDGLGIWVAINCKEQSATVFVCVAKED